MKFSPEKDLALCGLACVVCAEQDGNCPGCKAHGCKEVSNCTVYQCVMEKGLDGCYECESFPCSEEVLQGTRKQTFNRYAKQFGKAALLERLRINNENGITYHHPGKLTGDYDAFTDEEDVMRLIAFGSHTPYINCPILEAEHFTLRLVQMSDTADLLRCYSDPKAQPIFNADNCSSNFCYNTVEEMQNCIYWWLEAYAQKAFVRFAIIDNASGAAVGTIEMFGNNPNPDAPSGILRLDICSDYEQKLLLRELFSLCAENFPRLFNVNQMRTKATVSATERTQALAECGFTPCVVFGKADYFERKEI